MKSLEYAKKYKNNSDMVVDDDEFKRFREEEINTKKMTTILKNLNTPKRKTQENFFKANQPRGGIKSAQQH